MQFHVPKLPEFCFTCQQESVLANNHNPDMDTLGDRVKTLRLKLKLNQQQLAKRAGLAGQSGISAIERNLHKRPQHLHELAAALDTTVEYLLYGTNKQQIHGFLAASSVAEYISPQEAAEQKLLITFRRLTANQRKTKLAEIEELALQNQSVLQELSPDNKSNGTHG